MSGEREHGAKSCACAAPERGDRFTREDPEDDRELQGDGDPRGVPAVQEGGPPVRRARQGRHDEAILAPTDQESPPELSPGRRHPARGQLGQHQGSMVPEARVRPRQLQPPDDQIRA